MQRTRIGPTRKRAPAVEAAAILSLPFGKITNLVVAHTHSEPAWEAPVVTNDVVNDRG